MRRHCSTDACPLYDHEGRRTFEYRLYPNRAQRRQLMACLAESRAIYNEMLVALKAQHETEGTFPTAYDLNLRFKGWGGDLVPATTVQTLADRLSKALKHYRQLKDQGAPVDFPRFKTPNRWHSIQVRKYAPGRDVWLDDNRKHLHVPAKLGQILKIKLHRPLEGTPVMAHLILRADKHWYALIVCETTSQDAFGDAHPTQAAIQAECAHPAVGLDIGLEAFLADSESGTVENPRHYRQGLKRLAHAQRKACRRRKGSHRRRKASREVACQHLKISRQRRDFHFKTAKHYAEGYSRICVDDLNVVGMMKNHRLAKSIQDAGWSAFLVISQTRLKLFALRQSDMATRQIKRRLDRLCAGSV